MKLKLDSYYSQYDEYIKVDDLGDLTDESKKIAKNTFQNTKNTNNTRNTTTTTTTTTTNIEDTLGTLYDNSRESSCDDEREYPNDICVCSRCGVPGITHGLDIYECEKCGDILETRITNEAEWHNYSDGKVDPTRCSLPVNSLLPQSSLSSIMLYSPGNSNYNMRRTQKIHSWGAMTYKERCLHNIFQDISLRSCNGAILNNIIKTAHGYYKKISELHVSRGNIRKGLIAASLYMACKKLGVPRTTQEIAEIFQIPDKCVSKGNKKFTELWTLSGESPILYSDNNQSNDYIVRYCSKLDCGNTELYEVTKRISSDCNEKQLLLQNTPVSISAACIYYAILELKLPITRKSVSDVTKISEVTISKCLKELVSHYKKTKETA